MFTTAREVALEAENRDLRRDLALLQRHLDGTGDPFRPELFLGNPTEMRELTPNHPNEVRLVKMAEWKVSENEHYVPTMVGRTFDRAQKKLEMTFYCVPHPASKSDYINVLGELHGQCLRQLADMYRK